MAARAYWQGQIRLALVSIPVEIYTATKSGAQVSFKQIHEPSGKPIHYEKVVTGIGPVDTDEIMKGFEYEKGEFVLLEQDEIDAVKLESKKTLELTQFVDASEIDVLYYEKPYFVVPADDLAEEAFIVLREALRRTKKVGLGQLAMRGREYVVSLKPCGRGMVLETLRYADEVHKAQGYFREIIRGHHEIRLLVIEHVDLARVDELREFQRLLRLELHRIDLVLFEQDIFALRDLIALHDLVCVDRADAGNDLVVMDRLARGLVDLLERDRRT